MTALGKAWHSKNAKMVISLVIVVVLVLSAFLGLGFFLNIATPVRVVESSSMCIPNNTESGDAYTLDYFLWTLLHPFNRTLNVGDLIIIQGVDPKTLNTDYPNSDIIVYKKPTNPEGTPIVHRIVASYEKNGTIYFQTKGDGNNIPWPEPVTAEEYDSNSGIWYQDATVSWPAGEGVPANLVEGKVIMRIPYLGWITLFFRTVSWGLPLVIVIIMLLVILEFVLPMLKRKPQTESTVTEITI